MNNKGVFFTILVGLLWLLAACQQTLQTAPPTPVEMAATVPADSVVLSDSSQEAALALVRRFYDEYSSGNADIILEIHSETILMHYAGSSDQVPAQLLRDDLAALKEANPDLRAEIHSMYASGDMVITELTWTTTHTGDYFGIPATGKTTLHPGIVVRRLEDGLIVESWEMWDDLALFNSLGYVPSWDELIAGSAEVASVTASEPTPTTLPEVTATTVVGIWANLNDQEGNSYLILSADGTYQGKHGPSPEEGILVTEGTFTVAAGVVTFTDATFCPAGESYESHFLTGGRIRFDVIEVCGEDKLLPENPVLQLIK
jgi:steroid delta-isomerase-like uncharacterized protein